MRSSGRGRPDPGRRLSPVHRGGQPLPRALAGNDQEAGGGRARLPHRRRQDQGHDRQDPPQEARLQGGGPTGFDIFNMLFLLAAKPAGQWMTISLLIALSDLGHFRAQESLAT